MTATPDRPATTPEGAGLASVLHEVWLRIHVRRFDGHEYPDGRPDYVSEKRTRDSWYDGVIHSERIVEEFASEHGILNIRTALAARAHDYAARLSERTEGAGEVALSEREWVDRILAELPLSEDGTGHVADCGYAEAAPTCGCYSLPARIAAVLARRALSTVGRVVEVERVAEQVLEAHQPEVLRDYARVLVCRCGEEVPNVSAADDTVPAAYRAHQARALAAAIRADGSAES